MSLVDKNVREAASKTWAGTASRSKQQSLRVLCIDDDPDITSSLSRRFKGLGIETMVAFQGNQGIWMACTEKPDVVLLDLRMPGSHGEEVIECLRLNALTRHIPIIVLSGSQEYGVRQRVLAEGADCFLRKPTPFLQILEAVVGLASGNAPQDFP